jgi:hypothetical protein
MLLTERNKKYCALKRSTQACPRRSLFSKRHSTVGCTPVNVLNQCMPTRNYGLSRSCADFHKTHTYLTALRAAILRHISHQSWAVISLSLLRLARGWTVRGSNPVGGEIFRICPDHPGAHPTSYTMGTGSFPGVQRPGLGVDHPPSSSAEVKERVEL